MEKGQEIYLKVLHRFDNMIEAAIEDQIFECTHCGCEVYHGGYSEVLDGEELKFCCESCAQTYKKLKQEEE